MKKITTLLTLLPSLLFAQQDSSKSTSIKEVVAKEVIVSSTRATEKDPTTFQNISKDELRKNNLGQDLPYLLDNTPSLITTSDAGGGVGYTGMRIRGSDATRISVTLNDVPVNDAESQGMYWVDLPDLASSLQSIQIQRGVGKSANGAGAFGASVNLKTEAFSAKPFIEFNNSYGSFQTLKHTFKLGTGLIKNIFFADAGVSKISSNGYVERAASDLYSYHAQLGFVIKKAIIRLVYFGGQEKTYQSWYGVPEDSLHTHRRLNIAGTDYFSKTGNPYDNQVDKYRQDYLQLIASNTFRQTDKFNLYGKATLFGTFGKGYYEEYKVGRNLSDYAIPVTDVYSDLIRRKWLDNVFYGGVISLHGEHSNGFSWVAGGMVSQYRGAHFGRVLWVNTPVAFDPKQNYYLNNGLKNDDNVYANLNYFLKTKSQNQKEDGVNFMLDVQYRFVSHHISGTEDFGAVSAMNKYNFVNPKAGISFIQQTSYHFPFKMYASYAYANHEPSRDDLVNSATTKPEKMHDAEIGFQETNHRFPFSFNYYMMYYNDQLIVTGKLNDVGNAIRVNVPVSYRTGIEVSGSFGLFNYRRNAVASIDLTKSSSFTKSPHLFIRYNFTYALNKIIHFEEAVPTYDESYTAIDSLTQKIKYNKTNIAFSPSFVGNVELDYFPFHAYKCYGGLEFSLNTKFVSRQYLDNTSNIDRSLKPYWYSNLRVSYPYRFAKGEVRFSVLLNNIFNRLYESNGYTYRERYVAADGTVSDPVHYNSYYPQAGFNFSVGIDLKF